MKLFRFSSALLLAGCLSGCASNESDTSAIAADPGAPAALNAPAPSDGGISSTTNTINTVATKVTTTKSTLKKAPPKKAAPKPKMSSAPAKPDPRYRVVPEGPPEAQAFQVPPPPTNFKVANKVRVRMTTSKGAIVLELNAKEAPLHVKSFAYLANRGFFNGTVFHRWADLTDQGGGIIQGGDPTTKKAELKDIYGQGGPGYQIPRERNALKHQKLVIAAARTSDPDSAGSQFYITQGPTEFLDQDEGYTVFGRVVQGDKVALSLLQDDKLQRVEVLK